MTQTTEDSISRVLAERAPSVGAMLLEQVKASGPREAFRYLEGDRLGVADLDRDQGPRL